MMSKRGFLASGAALLGLGAAGASMRSGTDEAQAKESFPVTKSDAEWKQALTPEQYRVLRDHGTERAFTSPLNDEKRRGTFHCAGCDNPVFDSQTKFESGTGWPSFYDGLPNAIGYSQDRSFFMVRTEEHCARCGGHLGHVFDDGPAPTGKRHCINGVALTFKPAAA